MSLDRGDNSTSTHPTSRSCPHHIISNNVDVTHKRNLSGLKTAWTLETIGLSKFVSTKMMERGKYKWMSNTCHNKGRLKALKRQQSSSCHTCFQEKWDGEKWKQELQTITETNNAMRPYIIIKIFFLEYKEPIQKHDFII